MNLRERFQNSRKQRIRKVTVEGIGEFDVLMPSTVEAEEIRSWGQALKEDDSVDHDQIMKMALTVSRYVVDEDRNRIYSDEETDQIVNDLDPFALAEIFGAILRAPDSAKNSQTVQSVSLPSA